MTDAISYIDKEGVKIITTKPDGNKTEQSVASLGSTIYIPPGPKEPFVEVAIDVKASDRIDAIKVFATNNNVLGYRVMIVNTGETQRILVGNFVSKTKVA